MSNELVIISKHNVVSIPLDKVCYTSVSYDDFKDEFEITISLLNSEVLKFYTGYGGKYEVPPAVKCLELANSKEISL